MATKPTRTRSSKKSSARTRSSKPATPKPEPAERTGTDGRSRLPDYARDWPKRGGLGGPQPWDLRAQGITVAIEAEGDPSKPPKVVVLDSDRDEIELAPGAADVVSPIVPVHGRPWLAPGSIDVGPGPAAAGAVAELGQLLALLGYESSVSRGVNHLGVFDDSLAAAVERFCADYDVAEDPSQFQRNGQALAQTHVGPWVWEAVLRAAERVEAEADDDRRQLAHARRAA